MSTHILRCSRLRVVDEAELRQRRQPLGLVLIDDDLRVPVLDRLEGNHEQPLDARRAGRLAVDDLLVAREQPVEEVPQDLLDHLLLGLEVVIEAAREDARRVGDVPHGRRAQAALGEHRRGEFEKLVAAAWKRPVHPARVSTKRLLGQRGLILSSPSRRRSRLPAARPAAVARERDRLNSYQASGASLRYLAHSRIGSGRRAQRRFHVGRQRQQIVGVQQPGLLVAVDVALGDEPFRVHRGHAEQRQHARHQDRRAAASAPSSGSPPRR